MMSQAERLRSGQLAETEIQLPPSTNEDKVLSRLNQNYRLSKAQQILRLLKDQDELNKRFRDCALLDDDDDGGEKGPGRRQQADGDEDSWSVQEEQRSEAGGSDTSENEAERRAARRVALRKHRNSLDPGRCKTSMGFYNEAEVTEIPYDTDSDNVAGFESACSTPRGVTSGSLSARGPPRHGLYGALHAGGRAGGGAGGAGGGGSGNARLRVYHLKMGESDVNVRELAIPEECVVQSARSSRPKTSMTPTPSPRNHYYRQQAHPESPHGKSPQHKPAHQHQHQHHSCSRSHSHGHGHGQHQQHNQHQQQPFHYQQQQQPFGGVGDTRQAIISRLDPHHPMAVRPFCESMGGQEEPFRSASQQSSSSQPSTPRGGSRGQGGVASYYNHTEVTLFDMAPALVRDSPSRSSSRRAAGGVGGGGGGGGHGTGLARSTSFADHQRVLPASNRTLLSVDSSPIQLGDVSPRGRTPGEDPGCAPRRPRSTRVKKRVGEMPRGPVHTSMHVIGERAHPAAMTVMKLPPLDSPVSKGGSGRDLVCVGKD